jgi:precorrin-6A synthase
LLVEGPLAVVRSKIAALRAQERARHGWIMDIYLMRKGA